MIKNLPYVCKYARTDFGFSISSVLVMFWFFFQSFGCPNVLPGEVYESNCGLHNDGIFIVLLPGRQNSFLG